MAIKCIKQPTSARNGDALKTKESRFLIFMLPFYKRFQIFSWAKEQKLFSPYNQCLGLSRNFSYFVYFCYFQLF